MNLSPAQRAPRADRAAGAIRLLFITSPALLLAACGGAGGPGPASLSSSTPPAQPAPVVVAPPAPAANHDTAEYRRSTAAVGANVLPAWNSGASGAGVTIGIIDSGLTDTLGEFTGRISSASRDVTGQGRSLADPTGHGTAVAAVAAAARNDSGMSGIAPAATLAVMRADSGDCADGCRFTDSALATGVDAAVAAGAKVINISLSGSNANLTLRNAFAKAAAAGTVLVLSAGNSGESDVAALAQAALASAGAGNVIIAGAADGSGAIASFSNRAGSAQANYLTAPGVSVRSFNHQGEAALYSGTSFAAPTVTGAVALLAHSFPNLSASKIVEILLASADDAGDKGTDAVYGRGLLNVGKAMAPSGPTSLAGTTIPVAMTDAGSLGGAFGDGISTASALSSIPVTDAHDRHYAVSPGRTLRTASAARLAGRLESASLATASTSARIGGYSLALQIRASDRADRAGIDGFRDQDRSVAHLGFAQRGLDARAGSLNPLRETRLSFSGEGPVGLVLATGRMASESLPGASAGGFITDDGLSPDDGTGTRGRLLLMAEHHRGPLTLAMAASQRSFSLTRIDGLGRTARQDRLTLAAAYDKGPWRLALHATSSNDDGALLGTRLAPAFGLLGGQTLAIGGAAGFETGGYTLRLAATTGWTEPRLADNMLLKSGGRLRTQSWSVAGTAPVGPGVLSLRFAGPVVVTGGQFLLANGTPLAARANARETAAELGYSLGRLSVAAYQRNDAGNMAGRRDRGAAFTWRAGF